jgi:ABC-type amino acid transport substrate-binding protein
MRNKEDLMWHQDRARVVLSTIVAAMALLTLPVVFAGCGSSSSLTTAEKDWLAQKGTLQVGAFTDYPPYGFVDGSGQAVGISADYWNLVAERLGVKVTFTPVAFADQIEGLKQGRFDSLQGIFPVPEREQWFAFSDSFYVIDTHMYVDAAHADVKTLDNLKGLKVAVVDGDSGQLLANDAGLTTVVVEGYQQAVEAVASGAAQAMILDELVADYYINSLKVSDKVKIAGEPVASGKMTLAVGKDNTVLLGILNKGIAMVSAAEVKAISDKWLGQ